MDEKEITPSAPNKPPRKNLLRRTGRVLVKVFAAIILLLLLVIILIQIPPVQNLARKKVVSYLESKLETTVRIGKIYIGLPRDIILSDVYVEDREKDTLFSGGEISVDISMLRLLRNQVEINEIHLEDVYANIKRQLPDTAFNFQFIIDAFTPASTSPTADTAAVKMNIHSVILDNIRLKYKDIVSGSDMDVRLQHLDGRIDTFDQQNLVFSIPEINMRGFNGKIFQLKPLATPDSPQEDIAEAQEPVNLQLRLKDINISRSYLDYRNDVSAFYSTINLDRFEAEMKNVDLPAGLFEANRIDLEKSFIALRLGAKPAASVVKKEAAQEVEALGQSPFKLKIDNLQLTDNRLKYDDDAAPELAYGMDYAHLDAKELTLHTENFLFTGDTIAGDIRRGSFREKSGFILSSLRTDFMYSPTGVMLHNLVLATPGTLLRRSTEISYPSLEAMQNDPATINLHASLRQSRVQVKDILVFAPQLRGQPGFEDLSAVWNLNGDIHGSMQQLFLNDFTFRGLSQTSIHVDGNLSSLTDMNNLSADLDIREFNTSRSDLMLFMPPDALPSNISLPDHISMQGSLRGNAGVINTNLALSTSAGDARINGVFRQLTDPANISYDANVQTQSLNLGYILQMPDVLGSLTGKLDVTGRGTDPNSMSTSVKGIINNITYNNYTYRNINLDGQMQGQQFMATASIADPNIDLDIEMDGTMAGQYPSINFTALVDSIKTQPLNLTTDSIIYRGSVTGNFPATDPDRLEGTLMVTKSLMVYNGQRMNLDTMQLQAGGTEMNRYLQINSAPITARLEGRYKLTELGTVIQQSIQPYFNIVPASTAYSGPVTPYNFTFTGTINDHPLVKGFVPELKELRTIQIDSRFSNDSGLYANVNAPYILYGTQEFRDLQLNADTENDAILVNASVGELTNGPSFKVYKTNMQATVANNEMQFDLQNLDRQGEEKYVFGGRVQQPVNGEYVFSLDPGSVILNYEPWTVSGNNRILLNPQYVNVSDFVLSRADQEIRINSAGSGNAPIDVRVANFQLATITAFVKQDSLALTGVLNGEAQLKNILQQPLFTSDLQINDLAFNQDTVGNVNMQVRNTSPNTYNADVTITGRGNDISINGNYFADGRLALRGDIRALQLNTIEGSTFGALSDASGNIDGQVNISGTLTKPDINGELNFNEATFTVNMLGSRFTIDDETLAVNDRGLQFNTFTIRDSAGNTAILDGYAYTADYTNFTFDINLRTDDFRAINSTKKQNSLYYGALNFDSDLNIHGTNLQPVVDGTITVNENTNFTVVLPQQQPGIIEREGIIEFIDMDLPGNDSLFLSPYDSLNTSTIVGFDVATNIEVNRDAIFNIVIDEANGDLLNLRGDAYLTAGIDPSGNITLSGSYELYEGSYKLSFNMLQREFNIQRGSRIIWKGTPTNAEIDLTATYIADAAPLDLVERQLMQPTSTIRNYYRQRLPFEVYLYMQGDLMRPQVSFDVVLPEDRNYNVSNDVITTVRTRLTQLREQPSELNKQVFALLLLNRFVSENPFQGSDDGLKFETFARQSVSKLLTEQLNRLAGGLISGVDLNFDIIASDDYTTGERQDRTDLNVGLSKQLLNDRLRISVGSNFELEGPRNSNQKANNIGGNIAVDYQLSKDGRYVLRAYRKNEYEVLIEGHVIETGLSFIITLDYDHFRDLFGRRRREDIKMPSPEHNRPIQETDKKNN